VSCYLLVELREDLAEAMTTHTGVWVSIGSVAGVKCITDLDILGRASFEDVWRRISLVGDEDLVAARSPRRRSRERA